MTARSTPLGTRAARAALTLLAPLAALAVLAAGCGAAGDLVGDDDAGAGRARGAGGGAPMTAGDDIEAVRDRFRGEVIDSDDEVVLAALRDIEAFWTERFPEVFDCDGGCRLEPVSGGFYAYGPDTEQPPCGSPAPSYDLIADNAFYCPGSDLIAWDTASLVPALRQAFGDFALAIVMAHEYGHAIAVRAGLGGLTITSEQRADCWAGAWVRWADDGHAENFDVTRADLDLALAGFLRLRDAVGTPATDPLAHGSAFDRIGAFQEGFLDGEAACAAYDDRTIDVIPILFNSREDLASGGNAPFDDVEAFTVEDLDNFWAATLPAVFGVEWTAPDVVRLFPSDGGAAGCGDVDTAGGDTAGGDTAGGDIAGGDLDGRAFYCAANDTVAWDEERLMPELYVEVGDFAVSTTIGSQYALAAQVKAGELATSPGPNLQADCFTGAWVASSVIQDRGAFDPEANPVGNVFVVSPGDLDEAVITFLRQGAPGGDPDLGAGGGTAAEGDADTAFVRLTAFRTGFMAAYDAGSGAAGVDRCAAELALGDG